MSEYSTDGLLFCAIYQNSIPRFNMLLLTLLVLAIGTEAYRTPLGGLCNISNSHLDPDTKAFVSDCDSFGLLHKWDLSPSTMQFDTRRRDEYLLSSLLDVDHPIPPQCPPGSFCPDDASACLPLVPLGGRCQLNRDDECISPASSTAITSMNQSSTQSYRQKAVCLAGICMLANATLGQACMSESTTYIGYDISALSFTHEVTRDNCVDSQGYCDTTSSTCSPLRALGEVCTEDRECLSFNCDKDGVCTEPPESTVHVQKWIYALIGLGLSFVVAVMIGILTILIAMHSRNQATKRIMLEDYYKEQTAYRNSILSFHSAPSRDSSKMGVNPYMSAPPMKEMSRSRSAESDTTLVDGISERHRQSRG